MRKIKLAATSCLTFLLVATAIILSAGALTGCNGDKCITGQGGNAAYDLSAVNGKKTTIKVYADGEDYMKALIQAFEVKNPTINVEHVQVGAVDTRARMQLEGKDGADVFVFPHDHVGIAMSAGMLAEMPSAVAGRLTESLQESTMNTIKSSNDKYYGVPLSAETLACFYNQELLIEILTDLGETEKATALATKDLAEVLTLDEIVELSYEYNKVGTDQRYLYAIDIDNFYHNYMFLTAFGYQIFGASGTDATKPNFDTDAVKNGLKWIQKYAFKDGNTSSDRVLPTASTLTEADYFASFQKGETAMIVTGPWNIASAQKEAEKNDFTLKVTSIPTINVDGKEVHPVTFSGVQVAGVSQYSANKDAAWLFTEFIVSAEAAGILYNETGKLPCLKDTTLVDGLAEDPLLAGISKQLAYSKAMPSISEMGYMWDIGAKLVGDVFDGQDIDKSIETATSSYNKLAGLGQ